MFGRNLQWSHLVLGSSLLKGFDRRFNLLTSYWSVQIFQVMFQPWKIRSFQEFFHFFSLPSLLAYDFSYYALIIVFISVALVKMSPLPFSFLILFIWVFSGFFFLLNLARDLSNLLIFSKNNSFVLKNPVICYNRDAPWGHHAEWYKPVTKNRNTIWFYLHEEPRVIKFIETDMRNCGYHETEEGELFSECRVSVCKMEKFWRSVSEKKKCDYT